MLIQTNIKLLTYDRDLSWLKKCMFATQRTISVRHEVLPICINSRRITQKFTIKQSTLHNVNENDRNNSFSSRKVPIILIFVASSEQSVNKNGGYWAKHWCLADAAAMADNLKRNPDKRELKTTRKRKKCNKNWCTKYLSMIELKIYL